jgi:uncharacterized protein (TIGR00288 family)
MTSFEPGEERLALYLDFENVAIGARDLGYVFDTLPLLDALAERGKTVVRRAYADWNLFAEYRRGLVDTNIELTEIPQRNDAVRKNAADILMAVDAMELAFTRDFISTFVIVSGDSDFTPLVTRLRELNKKVIGVGLKGSTSKMLPPACDEFIFYDRLDGLTKRTNGGGRFGAGPPESRGGSSRRGGGRKSSGGSGGGGGGGGGQQETKRSSSSSSKQNLDDIKKLVARTLSGMQSSQTGAIQASNLKRALLRKDPTFTEGDYGFRGFREFIQHMADQGVVTLNDGNAKGDPEVDLPANVSGGSEDQAFDLLRTTVADLMKELGGDPPLSGLKDHLRKRNDGFSEKEFGYSGFLQFCKAAVTKNVVEMDWEEDDQEYYLYVEDAKK